jgi:hypothetical protein
LSEEGCPNPEANPAHSKAKQPVAPPVVPSHRKCASRRELQPRARALVP